MLAEDGNNYTGNDQIRFPFSHRDTQWGRNHRAADILKRREDVCDCQGD